MTSITSAITSQIEAKSLFETLSKRGEGFHPGDLIQTWEPIHISETPDEVGIYSDYIGFIYLVGHSQDWAINLG
jgi:hypothetical protein